MFPMQWDELICIVVAAQSVQPSPDHVCSTPPRDYNTAVVVEMGPWGEHHEHVGIPQTLIY